MSRRKDPGARQGHRTKLELATLAAKVSAEAITAASAPTLDGIAKANPIGDAPDYLAPAAKGAWNLAAPALKAVQLLAAPDRIAFARYCEWLSKYFELVNSGTKLKTSTTTKSRNGKMQRVDRDFQALLALDKRLMEYERAFGMTPGARQAIFARLATGYTPAPAAAKTEETSPAKKVVGFLNTGSKPPSRLQ